MTGEEEPAQRSIHVAHLTSAHPTFDSRIFHKECRSLADAGFAVSLVTVHPEDTSQDGVDIVAVASPSSRLARMLVTPALLLRRAWRLRADIYQFHDPELLLVGFVLKAAGRRVIYDVHEDVPLGLLHKDYLPMWLAKPLSVLAKGAHALADRFLSGIVVVTPDSASSFSAPTMVRNYPVLAEFSELGPPLAERDPIAVYIGAIAEPRGSQHMCRAVERAQWDGERRLILAGILFDPWLSAAIENGTVKNGVSYVGVLDRIGVRDLLNTARMGLLPLQPTYEAYITSYPTKLFEYMAAGLPVIAPNFPVIEAIVNDARCGIVIDPTDTDALAEAMNWLIEHPAEGQKMGDSGRLAVEEKYRFEPEAERLIELYQRLMT